MRADGNHHKSELETVKKEVTKAKVHGKNSTSGRIRKNEMCCFFSLYIPVAKKFYQ